MDESRCVIIGANGQLGRALQQKFPKAVALTHGDLDISDWQAVEAYDWSRIDIILNASVYSNVDGAETDEGRRQAWLINGTAVGYLSTVAAQHDITLVHVSSEYVFDGTQTPHQENELLAPLGVYGQSKAAGEIAASIAPKHYIIRTSWLIGDGGNFVRTMMGLADKDISPTVVADQVGRLTFTSTLAETIGHLLSQEATFGIYNVSNDGTPASWADITRAIFKQMGRNDLIVTDTTTEAYFANKPTSAPRPLQSTFELAKIKQTGLSLKDWREELSAYIEAEQAKPKE